MRAGEREDLDADEKADRTLSASAENRKRKPGERPTPVVQSKVVRQHDRVEALTGLGKSKGYGFLEMKSFNDALKVIRWANASKPFKLFGEWWKDDLQQQVDRIATQVHSKTKALEEKKGEEADALRAEIEELTTRKQRLRTKVSELEEGGASGDKERGGLLMIEIRHRKRRDHQEACRQTQGDQGIRRAKTGEDGGRGARGRRPRRACKREAQAARKIEADKNKPKGYAHGHVIGKKRKERRARRD